MKKKCSIRLFVAGILMAVAAGSCAGFFMGTQKNWKVYEKRIALLEEKNKRLERKEKDMVSDVRESLNVVEPYEYVLKEENGFVVVYHTDQKTLYASTGILVSELPGELQQEIQEGKYIGSEEQLYNFLENYSS